MALVKQTRSQLTANKQTIAGKVLSFVRKTFTVEAAMALPVAA